MTPSTTDQAGTPPDYISRVIATARQHEGSDNSWAQWTNLLADEIESLRVRCDQQERREQIARRALVQFRDNRQALTSGDVEDEALDWQPTFGHSAQLLAAQALEEMDAVPARAALAETETPA